MSRLYERVKTPTWFRVSMSPAQKTVVGANWGKICQEFRRTRWLECARWKGAAIFLVLATQSKKSLQRGRSQHPQRPILDIWWISIFIHKCNTIWPFIFVWLQNDPIYMFFLNAVNNERVGLGEHKRHLSNIHWDNYLGINITLGSVQKLQSVMGWWGTCLCLKKYLMEPYMMPGGAWRYKFCQSVL